MDYHLEKEVRLNDKTGQESPYSWCLQEVDRESKQVDLIPWEWNFHFTASELRLNQGFGFGELALSEDDEPEKEVEQKFEDSETITATMHPGICTDGKWLESNPKFSMFGTDRTIIEFTLRIYRVDDVGKERCSISGVVSYTSEIDFCDETSPDTIEVHLGLSKERFSKLSRLISKKAIDVVGIGMGKVSGFYSECSPSISTNSVKVLTRGSEQEITKPDGCVIDPPRLGEVGRFDLTLITRCKLNPKQNFKTLNISKLFENGFEMFEEEDEVEEQEDVTEYLMEQIAYNQAEIIKIKKPLWLVVVLLGLLLLTNMGLG